MKNKRTFAFALCLVSAGAFLLPDSAQARGAAVFTGGGHYDYEVWGWGPTAGVVSDTPGGAALYNSATCYPRQQVWNGFAYVWRTVKIC